MKEIIKITVLFICIVVNANSISCQITLEGNTIPDTGDVLIYTTFQNFEDTLSYRATGGDLEWTYDIFEVSGTTEEVYLSIDTFAIADSFPEANMILDLGLFNAVAIKSDTAINVIGTANANGFGGFGGVGANISTNLDDNFTYIKRPLNYQDTFGDSLFFQVQLDASIIPGIDSFDTGIPGLMIDSLRFSSLVTTVETADAWGTLNLLGESHDVLKSTLTTSTDFNIEIGAMAFGQILWIPVNELLETLGGGFELPGGFGIAQDLTNHRFYEADEKHVLLEFTENRIPDTSGVLQLNVDGRLNARILSSYNDLQNTIVSIYPNPTSSFININTSGRGLIFNMNGQEVLDINLDEDTKIDVSNLERGMYFILIKNEQSQSIQKFFKL